MRMVVILAALVNSFAGYSQIISTDPYPQGYFRNPLSIPMSLSGNFGELRPNHYHMGLDLKTNKVQNLSVFAAADGYISRIKIEPGGFGRAIYINHPNGYTSLYAHLNNFFPALEQYVKQKQYSAQSWSIYLEIPPDLFPVKKGNFIAYSGTTGGSQAPHVHFEIRKTDGDVNLNPFLFGFPIPDNTVPTILRVAIYDRTKSLYEQNPRLLTVRRSGNKFNITPSLVQVSTPLVSVGIGAYDTQTGSTNHNGIYEGDLYIDDQPAIGFQMDRINYNDTRYLNAHIDYKKKVNGGFYIQLLSELPGYRNSIYKRVAGNGTIDLSDGKIHAAKITVYDGDGNHSDLRFSLRYDGTPRRNNSAQSKMFYPSMVDGYEAPDCEFYLSEKSLYDSVHIQYARSASSITPAISALHSIGAVYIPLQEPITIRIKPLNNLTDAEESRTIMQRTAGGKTEVRKVEWNNGWAKANFSEFGNFQLAIDTEPPQIVPVNLYDGANLSKASRIVINIRDNFSQYENFRAELDGQWLRFTNDKGRSFIYVFDEKCARGSHELKISIDDEAGNRTQRVYRFTR